MKLRKQIKILARSVNTTVVMFVIQLFLLFETSQIPKFPRFPRFPRFPLIPLFPLIPCFKIPAQASFSTSIDAALRD